MIPFEFDDVVLKAGEPVRVEKAGRWFYMYDCEGVIELRFEMINPDGSTTYHSGNIKKRRGGMVGDFRRVYLTSQIDQTVDIGVSQQALMDNETAYSGAVFTRESCNPDLNDGVATVTSAGNQILAEQPLRAKGSSLQNFTGQDLWLRYGALPDINTSTGYRIVNGQSFDITSTRALFGRVAGIDGPVFFNEELTQ